MHFGSGAENVGMLLNSAYDVQWLYLGLGLVFVWGGARRGWFLVFRGLLLVLVDLSFWRGDWAPGYLSIGFRHS